MTAINILTGSNPAVSEQVNNPRLFNMYVDKDGLYRLPYLKLFSKLDRVMAIHETKYDGGSYIVATRDFLVNMRYDGSYQLIGNINSISNNIRIDETPGNQIIVTTGSGAYVYSPRQQGSLPKFVQLGQDQKFDLKNPVGVVVLNTFVVIAGGEDQKWIVSSPDNALEYNTDDIRVTDTEMGNLTGIQQLHNNLFIFGENASQRWTPSVERTQYDFPFTLDPSFRTEYGCIAPSSIANTGANIYFLGNNNIVMSLSQQGLQAVSNAGIAKTFDDEAQLDNASGSYFYYNNHYFYCLSLSQKSWVYCEASEKWSESDLLLTSADGEMVTTNKGVFTVSNQFEENGHIQLITEVILPKGKSSYSRNSINGVNLNITQGLESIAEPQTIDLAISTDNVEFGRDVNRPIALTGKRRGINIWKMNLAGNQFTLRFRYYGKLNLVFERLDVLIN